jgi:hypothetical protein
VRCVALRAWLLQGLSSVLLAVPQLCPTDATCPLLFSPPPANAAAAAAAAARFFRYLNGVVDDSDPDTDLDQLAHAVQTAEASRRAYPGDEYDWLHVTGFIHDLGKIMAVKEKGFSGARRVLCGIADIPWRARACTARCGVGLA